MELPFGWGLNVQATLPLPLPLTQHLRVRSHHWSPYACRLKHLSFSCIERP